MAVLIFAASVAFLAAAVVILGRYLPAQNVAFIILLLAGVEAGIETHLKVGNWLQGAFFWPGAIILLRTAVQKLLKPWRWARNYGLVLLALTSGGAAAIQWRFDSPGMAMLRFCVTAGCLLVLTPWLFQKRVTTFAEAKR
ncbi:MAG TPA: hypothetical protein VH595_20995 [Verrucomicrobiae bacterium]|jgi:hypothetical protein|nr:hypothetical protein [Verrucomicrobiae bacterium]